MMSGSVGVLNAFQLNNYLTVLIVLPEKAIFRDNALFLSYAY